jgi:hypothetical protein
VEMKLHHGCPVARLFITLFFSCVCVQKLVGWSLKKKMKRKEK